jgi:hypothetical protein
MLQRCQRKSRGCAEHSMADRRYGVPALNPTRSVENG